MRKSVMLRKIVLLLLAAVLLSGILTAGIYIIVNQRTYSKMREEELRPIALTLAEMMADVMDQEVVLYMQPGSTSTFSVGPLFGGNNRNFLDATLHVYNADGESILVNEQPGRGGAAGQQDTTQRTDLTEVETMQMLEQDMATLLAGGEVSGTRHAGNGEAYLVVGVPIMNDDEVVGAVVFTKSMQEMAESLRSLNLTLLVSMLIVFAVMLVPAYFFTRRLVVPIRQMRDVAQAMAEGDYTKRADESQKGEIGELAISMNHFAVESGKLEQTRQDYVANVSHELRTPIASIRAMGETLRDGMAKSDDKKELFYGNIVRESMRLSRLVDDLLELSRLQAGNEAAALMRFDLREVVQNVSDVYGHLAEESGKHYIVDPDLQEEGTQPHYVCSNPDRIEQVLVILLDNALKHAPEDGRITLAVSEQTAYTEISVINTGSEIPAEDLPYIFERFYKVDKSHSGGGTGLGLSIAKEIMKLLGGNIRAYSANQVTSFILQIPRPAASS